MRAFLNGFRYLLEGFSLVRQPGIRRFVWIPLAINVLVFSLAIYAALQGFEAALDFLSARTPEWLHWLRYLLWPVFVLTAGAVIFFAFALLANLLAAPFNGLLAEAVAARLGGNGADGPVDWRALIADIAPSLWSEVRKLLYALKWLVPCALLFVIPGLNLLAPGVWILFSAWMVNVEYSDYPLDNRGLKFPAQRRQLRAHRAMGLGFGAGALLLTMIPVINFVAMPVAVAGATAMWTRHADD